MQRLLSRQRGNQDTSPRRRPTAAKASIEPHTEEPEIAGQISNLLPVEAAHLLGTSGKGATGEERFDLL